MITETVASRASMGPKATLDWLVAREKRATTTSERRETMARLVNLETRAHPEHQATQVTPVYRSMLLKTLRT